MGQVTEAELVQLHPAICSPPRHPLTRHHSRNLSAFPPIPHAGSSAIIYGSSAIIYGRQRPSSECCPPPPRRWVSPTLTPSPPTHGCLHPSSSSHPANPSSWIPARPASPPRGVTPWSTPNPATAPQTARLRFTPTPPSSGGARPAPGSPLSPRPPQRDTRGRLFPASPGHSIKPSLCPEGPGAERPLHLASYERGSAAAV